MTQKSEKAPWLYQQQLLGFNYRITDIQCALGASQFKRINQTIEKRRKIFHAYQEAFKKNKNIQCPIVPHNTDPAWHLYIIRYIGDDIEWRIRTLELFYVKIIYFHKFTISQFIYNHGIRVNIKKMKNL